jgi:hypothetical membrane protein
VTRPSRFRIGAIAWFASFQFFVAQIVVQSAWTTPFHLSTHFISDLGNTACGKDQAVSGSYVCSPWHAWMNASFLLIGITIAAGAWLIGGFPSRRVAALGRILIALAGVGFVLVGLFPENVAIEPHRLGAALNFVGGNLGLAVLGVALLGTTNRNPWAPFSIVLGVVGLVATAMFVTGRTLGLGIGGIERFAAYPLPAATTLLGLKWMVKPL